jgi:hypothetical protein
MRLSRWRWTLVPMVVWLAGCLSRPPSALPADVVLGAFGPGQATVTVQTPPAGQTGQDIVAALRADVPMAGSRGLPVFAVVDCHGNPGCTPGPGGIPGGPARTVWVVLYPACVDADGHDAGWVVVDAVKGVDGGYVVNDQCDP